MNVNMDMDILLIRNVEDGHKNCLKVKYLGRKIAKLSQ